MTSGTSWLQAKHGRASKVYLPRIPGVVMDGGVNPAGFGFQGVRSIMRIAVVFLALSHRLKI